MKGTSVGDRISQLDRRCKKIEQRIPANAGLVERAILSWYIRDAASRLSAHQLARVVWPWQATPAKHTGGRGKVRRNLKT